MQYGIFIRVEQCCSRRWGGKLLSEDLSCREVSPAVLQKRLGFSIWYVVHPFFLKREDMKHETRMARLGVRSTSSTHHIHLDDYTHRIMSTLERESFLTISSLPTTYSIVLYCGCSEKAHFSTLHYKLAAIKTVGIFEIFFQKIA